MSSDDDKPPMRPQPKTIELPAMTDRALLEDLTKVVKSGFGEVRLLRADVDLLVGDLASLKVDVRELQKWKIGSEERLEKHSGGTRQLSQSDAQQDRALAETLVKVRALETSQAAQTEKLSTLETTQARQLELLEKLNAIAANPMVRRVAYAVGAAVLAYLTARGWLPK
jgi:hypothetical protein